MTSLVLLSVLADATADLYGYEIARRLTGDGERASPFKQGALYPVLRNMSAAGLLSSRVVPSYSGPPRRYYRITPLGHEVLQSARDLAGNPRIRRFHRPTVHSPGDHAMTAATPRTVEQYLDSLRSALEGADRALVQDALYDAEEHLRAELAQHPGDNQGDVLASIVASYGAPEEVATLSQQREDDTGSAAYAPAPPAHELDRQVLRRVL